MTKRRRHAILDEQPTPAQLRREATEIAVRLSVLVYAYATEHEAGWPPGGSGVHVMSGQSNPTESAFLGQDQQRSRKRCRDIVQLVRQASSAVARAQKILDRGKVQQPEAPSEDAVIDRGTFDQALHLKREREMRA